MGPPKAPGPDGFPAMFYHVHWELVKDMVCDAVRSFLGGDEIPKGFCDSIIVLIPEKEGLGELQGLHNGRQGYITLTLR
jgi:hypothetical protein